MASARTSLLAEIRKRSTTTLSGGGIRTLPLKSYASTTNSNALEAENKDWIERYNDGLVSNEQMKNHLQSLLGSSQDASERVALQSQIRDFDNKIQVQALTAAYNNTPKNSMERASAAKAIADYYNGQSQSLQSGTPAQSQALQNAGTWEQNALGEETQAKNYSRSATRQSKLADISSLPSSDPETALKKGKVFEDLMNQAIEDGNQIEADKYQQLANAEYQRSTALEERGLEEQKREYRQSLVKDFQQLQNDYHDGTITVKELAASLDGINNQALMIGDTSIQLSVNSFADKVSKDEAKGGLNRGNLGGLPVVLGRGKGGSGSGTMSTKGDLTWDEEDTWYTDNTRALQEDLNSGKVSGDDYIVKQAYLDMWRKGRLDERFEQLKKLGDKGSVVYQNDKQDALDLRRAFQKDSQEIEDTVMKIDPQLAQELQPFIGGNDKLTEESVDQFVASTNPNFILVRQNATAEDPQGKIQRVAKPANFSEGVTHVLDQNGIYHQTQGMSKSFYTFDEANDFATANGFEPPEQGTDGLYKVNEGRGVSIKNQDGTSTDYFWDANAESLVPSFTGPNAEAEKNDYIYALKSTQDNTPEGAARPGIYTSSLSSAIPLSQQVQEQTQLYKGYAANQLQQDQQVAAGKLTADRVAAGQTQTDLINQSAKRATDKFLNPLSGPAQPTTQQTTNTFLKNTLNPFGAGATYSTQPKTPGNMSPDELFANKVVAPVSTPIQNPSLTNYTSFNPSAGGSTNPFTVSNNGLNSLKNSSIASLLAPTPSAKQSTTLPSNFVGPLAPNQSRPSTTPQLNIPEVPKQNKDNSFTKFLKNPFGIFGK